MSAPKIKITPIFKSWRDRPFKEVDGLAYLVRSQTSITTWIVLGAFLQTLAFTVFTRAYYLGLLCASVLAYKLVDSLLVTYGIKANPFLKGVIPGRSTALLPEDDGVITGPASKKVVVLHLGAKANHPLGVFHTPFFKVGGWLRKMLVQQEESPGFMGQTTFRRQAENGALELILISYWDSIESLWAYAHSGAHREGWLWWEKTIKENGAVGLNHEIFEADAKHWENVYINFQPTLMGATSFLKKDGSLQAGKISDEWVSGLVDARRGPLAKSSVRFGRDKDTVFDVNRVGKATYSEDS